MDVEGEAASPASEPTVAVEKDGDSSSATFTLTHEDHTLGNAVRYILAKECALACMLCSKSCHHAHE